MFDLKHVDVVLLQETGRVNFPAGILAPTFTTANYSNDPNNPYATIATLVNRSNHIVESDQLYHGRLNYTVFKRQNSNFYKTVFNVYLPPQNTIEAHRILDNLFLSIRNQIATIKTKFNCSFFAIGGDFNIDPSVPGPKSEKLLSFLEQENLFSVDDSSLPTWRGGGATEPTCPAKLTTFSLIKNVFPNTHNFSLRFQTMQ